MQVGNARGNLVAGLELRDGDKLLVENCASKPPRINQAGGSSLMALRALNWASLGKSFVTVATATSGSSLSSTPEPPVVTTFEAELPLPS